MPVGLTAGGLPVGLQIVGPYLEDATPIDLIAIGHRSRGRLAGLLIGSVAKDVIDSAPCPVLVVR